MAADGFKAPAVILAVRSAVRVPPAPAAALTRSSEAIANPTVASPKLMVLSAKTRFSTLIRVSAPSRGLARASETVQPDAVTPIAYSDARPP